MERCRAEQNDLNASLSQLAIVFPKISPDVIREMLQNFPGESQLQVVTEELLEHQEEWVKGRWRANAKKGSKTHLAVEEKFRTQSYKQASRSALCKEFKFLNSNKIEAVLAEKNYCYTKARPILQQFALRSWRHSIGTFVSRLRSPENSYTKGHFMLYWKKCENNEPYSVPLLKEAGDSELNAELHSKVLIPMLEALNQKQTRDDRDHAIRINEEEARKAEALFECECCFGLTTFEEMVTCSTRSHVLCFRCVSQTANQTLFGMAWRRSIDTSTGLFKCFAPLSSGPCEGCIPRSLTQRAIMQFDGGEKILASLEKRLFEHCLLQAGLSIIRCPFCTYAEVDDIYLPRSAFRYKLNTTHLNMTMLLLLLAGSLIPLIVLYILVSYILPSKHLPKVGNTLAASLQKLSESRYRPKRFKCQSIECGAQSCMECLKEWSDPHTCHESAALSLRLTVESAVTAALKRTCPRCGVGFVKGGGCNKMVCVCGHVMCYLCRQDLGTPVRGASYRHFCQHFRPSGIGKCNECNKCDLHRDEDEETLALEASALAEQNWREREGRTEAATLGRERQTARINPWPDKSLSVQTFMDEWIQRVVTCS